MILKEDEQDFINWIYDYAKYCYTKNISIDTGVSAVRRSYLNYVNVDRCFDLLLDEEKDKLFWFEAVKAKLGGKWKN